MKARIYVACSSAEIPRVREFMRRVSTEYSWTHDWTTVVEEVGDANPTDVLVARRAAQADLDGVRTADVFVLLYPTTYSRGAFVELGIALGANVPVVIVGRPSNGDIFSTIPSPSFDTDAEAAEYLLGVRRD